MVISTKTKCPKAEADLITGSGALNVVTICDFGEKNNLIVALEEKTEDNQCLEVINVS